VLLRGLQLAEEQPRRAVLVTQETCARGGAGGVSD
jgi:hypothetical protein